MDVKQKNYLGSRKTLENGTLVWSLWSFSFLSWCPLLPLPLSSLSPSLLIGLLSDHILHSFLIFQEFLVTFQETIIQRKRRNVTFLVLISLPHFFSNITVPAGNSRMTLNREDTMNTLVLLILEEAVFLAASFASFMGSWLD